MSGHRLARQRLSDRLERILEQHRGPTEEEIPYLLNLAAMAADDFPGLHPAQVVRIVATQAHGRVAENGSVVWPLQAWPRGEPAT